MHATSALDMSAGTFERRRVLRSMRNTLVGGFVAFVAFLVVGNLVILTATVWARHRAPAVAVDAPPGIGNFRVVDEKLWRGAAPSTEGYAELARRGVATVIDLRGEDDIVVDEAMFAGLGINRVHIPIRDGQAPSDEQVGRFLAAVQGTPGKVFVHCGAGVGRTGTMVAAYLVSKGVDPGHAVLRNLEVGPPSLEQISFAASGIDKPHPALVAASRVLDAPRRIWTRLVR